MSGFMCTDVRGHVARREGDQAVEAIGCSSTFEPAKMVNMSWFVIAVSRDDTHRFSTANVDVIRLIKGFGVMLTPGPRCSTDQEWPPIRPSPTCVRSTSSRRSCTRNSGGRASRCRLGALGENVTTRGIDLLSLPRIGPVGAGCGRGGDRSARSLWGRSTGFRWACWSGLPGSVIEKAIAAGQAGDVAVSYTHLR